VIETLGRLVVDGVRGGISERCGHPLMLDGDAPDHIGASLQRAPGTPQT
jgi:hypothetical protein